MGKKVQFSGFCGYSMVPKGGSNSPSCELSSSRVGESLPSGLGFVPGKSGKLADQTSLLPMLGDPTNHGVLTPNP